VPDRVAVVYSVVSSLGRGVEGDLIPDEETALIAAAVAEALAEAGLRASLHPVDGPEALEQALARQESGATVIFNLCEALAGLSGTGTDPALSTAGGEIVAARIIADSGFRYTGAAVWTRRSPTGCLISPASRQRRPRSSQSRAAA